MYIRSLIPKNWPRQLRLYYKQDTVQKQSSFQAFQFHFRPDYISPLDDLAFDMYQDPEIAQIIRKLERKKQEAVLRMLMSFYREHSGSVVECLTQDRGAAGLSLTGVTALCP